MKCPQCFSRSTVLEKRERQDFVTRRHQCASCGYRFTTHETIVISKYASEGGKKTPEHMAAMREIANRWGSE